MRLRTGAWGASASRRARACGRARRLEAAAADAGRSALGLGAVRAEPLAVRDRVEADAREVRGVLAVLVLAVAEEERRRVALLAADDAGVVVPGLGLLELRQAELRVRVAGRARERARDVVVAVVRLARARDPAVRGMKRARSSRGGASSPARARGLVQAGGGASSRPERTRPARVRPSGPTVTTNESRRSLPARGGGTPGESWKAAPPRAPRARGVPARAPAPRRGPRAPGRP